MDNEWFRALGLPPARGVVGFAARLVSGRCRDLAHQKPAPLHGPRWLPLGIVVPALLLAAPLVVADRLREQVSGRPGGVRQLVSGRLGGPGHFLGHPAGGEGHPVGPLRPVVRRSAVGLDHRDAAVDPAHDPRGLAAVPLGTGRVLRVGILPAAVVLGVGTDPGRLSKEPEVLDAALRYLAAAIGP
ncbi:unnamed protein product [Pseudo-nitzschia multistriata]|uniref:Uncharacterized protein n=1 Tax=Pseudo-nitzschia multistriata TaxID=183589 RepID=A0A448ZJM3_9STRA|nr:unnamed protein product [Pseudo-nitzschia multistriata]